MAETTANEAAQRYAVIEQAYSKEQWASVLQDGEELLQQLQSSDNTQVVGLQMRLQLLLGHTHLYGYTDKTAASVYYGAVAEQSTEAALTKIAAQGLKQCAIEEAPAASAAAVSLSEAVTPASGAPAPASSGPAAPWLTQPGGPTTAAASATAGLLEVLPTEQTPAATPAVTPAAPWSEPSLIPDVVEEPELIELHQADPSLAEEVELSWKEPAPARESEDTADADLLSGLMLVRIS
ncbi:MULTISPECIES: hypothetical protein [unclassified Cyanobium]|uniref:hypothetical protein n=1 Tax=unclassified Cyanobium TaxID=2627006 RepID=UPI0020CDC2CD|nr:MULTISPECIES: hypothetical protein [unclassified Cyanobium]MCP9834396.1 hypothetical protein [Cyanobium sp. La Preciosa 7G6]MCP9937232.1 hypothetical protein [Cyanobium sp. Aljojuca 7A6]